jgi:hypothetical protein
MIHGVTKNQLEEPLLTPLDEWWTLTSKSLEVYAQYAFPQIKRDTSKDRGLFGEDAHSAKCHA